MHSVINLLIKAVFPSAARDWILLLADLLGLATIPSVLIRRGDRPLAALSWILALMAVPFFGVVSWWLLGRSHLERPRRRRRRLHRRMSGEAQIPWSRRAVPPLLRRVLPFSLEGDRRWSEGVYPPASAHDLHLLTGEHAFAAMEAAIEGARYEIRALYYIWQPDETGRRMAELLARKAQAGIPVKLIVDEVGSRAFLHELAPALRRKGVEVVGFLPASFRPWAPTFNFRNHRKLLLVDGRIGFTGGMNIGTEYEREWSDQAFQLSGQVLGAFDEIFCEDWLFSTNTRIPPLPAFETPQHGDAGGALCAVIASGPDRDAARAYDGILLAIAAARKRVWLVNPYFLPNISILDAIRCAGLRGIDVRILTPLHSDAALVRLASLSSREALLRSGVRLFEFNPRILHTKSMIVDDELSVIGSANFDTRSFRLNFELVCFVVSEDLNAQLRRGFEQDLSMSREIRLAEVAARSLWAKGLESAANLLSPLL